MSHRRKDYVAIAAILASEQERLMPQDTSPQDIACHSVLESKRFIIASRLADYFGNGNSRFDRNRFLAACGVQS